MAKKAGKKALKEKLNIELTKQVNERKKELGISKGRTKEKHDHDGNVAGSSKFRKKPQRSQRGNLLKKMHIMSAPKKMPHRELMKVLM